MCKVRNRIAPYCVSLYNRISFVALPYVRSPSDPSHGLTPPHNPDGANGSSSLPFHTSDQEHSPWHGYDE